MLTPKVESPRYLALMLSVPAVSVEIVRVAEPPDSVLVPKSFGPCRNSTVSPFGGDPLREVTVAVKVTDCPYVDGLYDEEIVVVVGVSAAKTLEVANRRAGSTSSLRDVNFIALHQ